MGFKIAIIGAGPAGCTLARLLAPSASHITIYESEASLHARSQGGTLDLRPDGGLAALQEAGLYDKFLELARFDGEALLIADKNLKAWLRVTEASSSSRTARPEIDRVQLRQLLMYALPADIVQWQHRVRTVTLDDDAEGDGSKHTLHFTDGTTAAGFDLVIGADGAWSKARAALTDVKPEYTGIQYVAFKVLDVATQHPELYELVRRGSVFTWSDGRSITAQYLSDGSLHCGAAGVRPADWLEQRNLSVDAPEPLRAALLAEYEGWADLLRALISAADAASFQARPLYMLPIGTSWEHRRGCTLLGDAAHLMTPYAGIGVNTAMHDAVDLARAIRAAEDEAGTASATGAAAAAILDTHIRRFETEMHVRGTEAQQMSWDNLHDMFLVPDAPRARIQEYIGRAVAGMVPPVCRPAARFAVRAGYGVFKLFR